MSIWTFDRGLVLAAGLALAACVPASEMGFLSTTPPQPDSALRAAVMGDGAIALTAPPGYCIDAGSMKPGFALIARCDTLGGAGRTANVPLALITATVVTQKAGTPAPRAADLVSVLDNAQVLQAKDQKGVALVQSRGETGLQGFSDTHWRGAFLVNDVMVGLALYAPVDSKASGPRGASILNALATQTKSNSANRRIAAPTPVSSNTN
jgi:hypothetical protein